MSKQLNEVHFSWTVRKEMGQAERDGVRSCSHLEGFFTRAVGGMRC